MRLSYADQLIELDRQRRNIVYGRETKRFHLKIIAAISGVLYATLYVMAWLYPRGVTHVWIDDVLVEVLEDSMIEQVGGVSGCIFVASLVLLLCMSLLKESSDKDRHGKKHRSPFAGACGPYRKAPGLSVPFSPATVQSTTTAGATEVLTEPIGVKGHHDLEGEYAIRTRAELDKFLSAKELPKRMEGSLPTAHNSVNATGTVSGSMATAPAAATSISAPLAAGGGFGSVSSEGIRVQYGSGGERASAAASADRPAETMWNGLGIVDPERSQVKVRKWLSDLCQTLVEEVDSTNRWFVERQLRHFDCGHSLDETIVVPPPSSAPRVGFGVPAQPVSSPPSVRKMDALMDERNKIATQGQNVQNIDVTMHIDQRLQLEMKLDTTATFTPSSPASVAEQQARRTYVVGRIRTFASQKSLASYHHNCGDISTWRDDFPTDAHLLTHILRTCVPGFTNYVRFPHQPLNAQQHLALVVGDTGEPYFYVRYRTGAVDKTYPTQPGPNSLFEALLLFSAVARTHHGALSLHLFDAYVFKGEDTPDLDFVLCHSNSTPNDFDGSSANPDRNRFADYSWLDAGTKPQFDMETPLTVRVQGLVEWIQRSYIKKCTGELSSTLGNINSKLSFDYDSYLSTISGADGRCVEGVVQDSIDHTCLALSIPLLQEKNEKICEDLGGILELYGKLTGLGGGSAPSVAKVEISLLMVLMVDHSSVNVKALREEVEIEAKGTEGWVEISIAELVRRVISLQGLPRHTGQFQKTLQRSSVCMMDFIPFLESALLNCLWEPLHFLQLVDHLTFLFGLPLDVNMGVDTTSAQGAQVSRTATFSYVCEEPQASALVVLRYNNSRTVPVVEVTVTQQTDPAKKEKTTSKHVKYRDDLDPKSKSSSISSGPIDVALLGEATIAACTETIVSLIKPCKRA